MVENKGVFGVVWIETNLNYDHVISRDMSRDFELCIGLDNASNVQSLRYESRASLEYI